MRLLKKKKTVARPPDPLGRWATAAAGSLLAMAIADNNNVWKWYTLVCILVLAEVSRNVHQSKLPFVGASILTLPFAVLYPGIILETGTPVTAAIGTVLTASGWRNTSIRARKKRRREERKRK